MQTSQVCFHRMAGKVYYVGFRRTAAGNLRRSQLFVRRASILTQLRFRDNGAAATRSWVTHSCMLLHGCASFMSRRGAGKKERVLNSIILCLMLIRSEQFGRILLLFGDGVLSCLQQSCCDHAGKEGFIWPFVRDIGIYGLFYCSSADRKECAHSDRHSWFCVFRVIGYLRSCHQR